MLRRFLSYVEANKKTIVVTFEVFWLLIFLIDRVTSSNSAEIPQFIYVNF